MQKKCFNKMPSILTALLLFITWSAAAQTYAPLQIKTAEPIVSSTASGGEVELVSGEFTPVTAVGGYGKFISYWQLKMIVEVEELAYDKVFRIVQPPDPTIKPTNPRIHMFSFKAGNVRYLGRSHSGGGLYELIVSEPYVARPGDQFRLEVIMPARYNSTPSIGMPYSGWYGPIYGLKSFEVQ